MSFLNDGVESMDNGDAKLLNHINSRSAYNTAFGYNTLESTGEFKFLSADEGGTANETDQIIRRR